MARRTKNSLLLPWYVIFPLVLLSFEITATRFYPFSSPYFSVLLAKQPVLLSLHSLLALFRVYLAYLFLALGLDLATRRLLPPFAQMGLFFIGYVLSVFFSLKRYPGLLECFPYISKTQWVFLVVSLCLLFRIYSLRRQDFPGIFKVASFLTIPLIIFFSAYSPWKKSITSVRTTSSKSPSFFILSFDAVPEDLFSYRKNSQFVAPLWHSRWEDKSVHFKNAYSVTNTTYTSWFATLTGRMPLETGVLSLYPSERTGNVTADEWIPRKLQEKGYQTAFMTDCANTSFMKEEFGFGTLFQPDQGAFKSTRALVASVHPGLHLFTRLFPFEFFFPELTSFSSHQYNPDLFFDKVLETWKGFDNGEIPYALFVHSCLTHRDMAHHLPDQDSPLRQNIPQYENYISEPLSELFLSIRMADQLTDRLFSTVEKSPKPVWRFLTSDHGIRIDPKGEELTLFSHGIGDAIGRFQYNVPLAILPPTGSSLSNDTNELVTIQDLGAFLITLSENEKETRNFPVRSQLILTSAVPSDTPGDWGKTLIPLIRNGDLKEDGTFSFGRFDDEALNEKRSRAILRLPYRSVWNGEDKWEIFDELKDPFNTHPLAMDESPLI